MANWTPTIGTNIDVYFGIDRPGLAAGVEIVYRDTDNNTFSLVLDAATALRLATLIGNNVKRRSVVEIKEDKTYTGIDK